MTFKQWMRRLFSDLWHRCAEMGKAKIGQLYPDGTGNAEWWEAFIERCEKRALRHAEFVPGKYEERSPAISAPAPAQAESSKNKQEPD